MHHLFWDRGSNMQYLPQSSGNWRSWEIEDNISLQNFYIIKHIREKLSSLNLSIIIKLPMDIFPISYNLYPKRVWNKGLEFSSVLDSRQLKVVQHLPTYYGIIIIILTLLQMNFQWIYELIFIYLLRTILLRFRYLMGKY